MPRLPALILLLPLLIGAADPSGGSGVISNGARSIGDAMQWSEGAETLSGSARFRSPDGRSLLDVQFRETGSESDGSLDHRTEFHLSGAAGAVTFAGDEALGDVLWSPDGLHVAVSLSGGGLNGQYRLVVAGGGRNARKHEDSASFAERVKLPAACDLRDVLNVGAVTWLSERRLLVAVQPLWEERCVQRRAIAFFEYDIEDGRIVRELPTEEARLYRTMLGPVLAG